MNRPSKEEILISLYDLGIREGDNLFIIADLMKIGYINESREATVKDWIFILKDLVGKEGSIILPAYNSGFFRFKKKEIIFNNKTKSYCGSLTNALINHEDSFRSSHPMMSIVGFGKNIELLIKKHNYESLSYEYIKDFLELKNSKFLMLGTYNKTHFPQTFHYVQEKLGITKKNILKGFLQIYYYDHKNNLKLFTRKDFGGCSRGAYKLYDYFKNDNTIKVNKIGNSQSAIIDANQSYSIISKVLLENPKIYKCDNKDCIDCFGNPYTLGIKSVFYFLKYLPRLLKKTHENYYIS